METVSITEGSQAKLQIAISSEAIVGTNVSLNDVIIRQSKQYKFNMELQPIAELDNSGMSIVSSFFVTTGNINHILNNTIATFTISYDDQSHEIKVTKQKITATFFIVYAYVKLIKS